MAKKTAYRQVDRVIDYKEIFGSVAGKKVLYDMMKAGNMLQSSFDKDPHEMAFNEGQRNMVLRILTLLKTDPMELRKFIQEREEQE